MLLISIRVSKSKVTNPRSPIFQKPPKIPKRLRLGLAKIWVLWCQQWKKSKRKTVWQTHDQGRPVDAPTLWSAPRSAPIIIRIPNSFRDLTVQSEPTSACHILVGSLRNIVGWSHIWSNVSVYILSIAWNPAVPVSSRVMVCHPNWLSKTMHNTLQ